MTALPAMYDGIAIINGAMASLTIRKLDDQTKARLRVRAAHHGRSMEAEVRVILQDALASPQAPGGGLGSRMHARFAALGGVALELPSRTDMPRAASLSRGPR